MVRQRRRFRIRSPVVVWSAALLAALLRFPGAMWPIRADEAGYLLVARHWDPQPDSMYGTYWLDRPPILVALVKLADEVGGPLFPRIMAAVGCAVLVVAAAGCARIVAGDRAAAWTAVATMAVTANTMIDTVAAKGEILAVPLIVVSFWLALRALDRDRRDRRAVVLAAGSGLAATLALGFKQNMAAGLVFGAVLLVGSLVTERIDRAEFARLAAAALAGAAVPVVGTAAWALWAGVRLESVWDALYGFRGDALLVIAEGVVVDGARAAPAERALVLLAIVLATGMAFVIGGVIVHFREVWVVDPVLTSAAMVVLAVDGTGLMVGGSFWRAYLFALVPGTVLCMALLLAVRGRVARRARTVAMAALVCSLVSSVAWVVIHNLLGVVPPTEAYTGHAVASAARPGDTIVVYGGRPDVVLASGLRSPYEYLWSLPMRTRDPGLKELRALLGGDDAPTWVVEWVPFGTWETPGHDELRQVIRARYRLHGHGCGAPVYLLEEVQRPPMEVDCDKPWRTGLPGADPPAVL